MSQLELQHTNVFSRTMVAFNDPNVRFIIEQGGSRSSKTYSIIQLIIVYCLTTPGKMVSIIRKTFPTLRGTVMRDFFEVMNELGIYDEKNHHKTEQLYTFPNGSQVEFFGADNGQKLRGRKRDILYVNESINHLKSSLEANNHQVAGIVVYTLAMRCFFMQLIAMRE